MDALKFHFENFKAETSLFPRSRESDSTSDAYNFRQCQIDSKLARTIPHDCRLNCRTSSKGMESALAAQIVGELVDAGHRVKCVVTDGDSATINAIHEQVDQSIDHGLDVNHVSKGFLAALVKRKKEMQADHLTDAKLLTDAVLERLRRSFALP